MARGRWYNLPFVVGHHHGTKHGYIQQDGYLGSIQVFLITLSLGSALILSASISTHQSHAMSTSDLDLFLVTCMVLSCVLILVMYMKRVGRPRTHTTGHFDPTARMTISDRLRRVIKDKLPIVGILCFFVPSIFLDLFSMAAHIDCVQDIYICGSQKLYEYGVSVTYNIARILFMSMLVGFALYFHSKRFTRQIVAIRFILMFLLAAVLVMWFDTFVHDFNHHKPHNNTTPHQLEANRLYKNSSVPTVCHNDSKTLVTNTTQYLYQCLQQETSLFSFLTDVSSFLYPVNIEFALLVTEIVAHLYFDLSHKKKEKKKRKSRLDTRERDHYLCIEGGQSQPGNSAVVDVEVHSEHESDNDNTRVKTKSPNASGLSNETFVKISSPENSDNKCLPGDSDTNDGLEVKTADDQSAATEVKTLMSEGEMSSSPKRSSFRKAGKKVKPGKLGVRIKSSRVIKDLPDTTHPDDETRREELPTVDNANERTALLGAQHGAGLRQQRINTAPVDTDSIVMVQSHSDSDSSMDSSSISSTQSIGGRRVRVYCSAIIALLINAILFTMSLLGHFQVGSDRFLLIYHVFRVSYFIVIITCIYLAFHKCEKFESRFQDYSGLDMMVIITQAGFFLNAFMSLIAYSAYLSGSTCSKHKPIIPDFTYGIPVLTILDKVLDIYCMFLQTGFIFHVSRIQAPESGYESERNFLKQSLLFVAISNIVVWSIDSFIEITNLEIVEPIQMYYFSDDNWSLITHMTLPLVIFYRFNSFFLLIGAFLDH